MGALIFLAAMLALSGGEEGEKPGRMKLPDPPPPPRAKPPAGEPPPTMQMLAAPQPPPPPNQAPPPGVNRDTIDVATAYRTETRDGTDLPIAPMWSSDEPIDTSPGKWLVVRVWISTTYAPVQNETRPRAAMWAFVMPSMIGTMPTLEQRTLTAGRLPGNSWPPITWLNVTPRIRIDGKLELLMLYPGRSHTGPDRGRDYRVVIEWFVLPSKPPIAA